MPRQFDYIPFENQPRTPVLQGEINQRAGADGVKQTLTLMAALKQRYKTDPRIRELALSLIADKKQKDYAGEIESCRNFVKYSIRYVKDIAGVETVQSPIKTLEYQAGDCDDKSTLLAALLESIGHPCRFVAIATTGANYCHVYPEVKLQNKWVALETTEPVQMGWKPPAITASLYDSDDGAEYDASAIPDGLGLTLSYGSSDGGQSWGASASDFSTLFDKSDGDGGDDIASKLRAMTADEKRGYIAVVDARNSERLKQQRKLLEPWVSTVPLIRDNVINKFSLSLPMQDTVKHILPELAEAIYNAQIVASYYKPSELKQVEPARAAALKRYREIMTGLDARYSAMTAQQKALMGSPRKRIDILALSVLGLLGAMLVSAYVLKQR